LESGVAVSRRRFLAGAGGIVVLSAVGGGQALAQGRRPSLRGGRFLEGVLSGDPGPRGITVWTRVADADGAGTVELEVARDRGFRRAVSREPVRFAFFSCKDYGFGYFNAHALMAGEDIDFVVNLGDYIYAEANYTTAAGTGVRTDPVGLSETLEQYRAKYAVYRSDPRLRRMHSRFPMVSIWDDHEVQNNYAGGAGPRGGLLPEERYSRARRAAASTAPTSPAATPRWGRSARS
jgi:alkaline phosphatase D